MEEVILGKNKDVKLVVKISSDAMVGSNVSLNDTKVRNSGLYNFNSNLGNSKELDSKILSIVSNFFVSDGNIKMILKNTSVTYVLKFGEETKEFTCKKVKINAHLFMAYFVIKLKEN